MSRGVERFHNEDVDERGDNDEPGWVPRPTPTWPMEGIRFPPVKERLTLAFSIDSERPLGFVNVHELMFPSSVVGTKTSMGGVRRYEPRAVEGGTTRTIAVTPTHDRILDRPSHISVRTAGFSRARV